MPVREEADTVVAPTMERYVLVNLFHEIALKGGNRHLFLQRAMDNLKRSIAGTGVTQVRRGAMHTILRLSPEADWALLRERLGQVFGVQKFALGYRAAQEMEAIKEAIASALGGRSFTSFRITAKRTACDSSGARSE